MSAASQLRWSCRTLGDGLLATVPLNEIQHAFAQLYPQAVPPDAAVFLRHRLDGLQCEVTVFFSPGVDALARQFGAHRCYRPSPAEVELLIGSAEALQ